MTAPRRPHPRSARIAASFAARAHDYDRHAELQRRFAAQLAAMLPSHDAPRVLELASGTGLFSRHLLEAYPRGDITLSDLSPQMLEQCRRNLGCLAGERTSFAVIDANGPVDLGAFDLIATSMSLHWLEQPLRRLEELRRSLKPGGSLLFSGLGEGCFAEWRAALQAEDLPSGLVALPALPGMLQEERLVMEEDGLAFLRRLKAIGGLTPAEGYRPLSPAALRRVLRRLQTDHAGRVTWHIVYGRLSPIESSDAASRSRPSTIPL